MTVGGDDYQRLLKDYESKSDHELLQIKNHFKAGDEHEAANVTLEYRLEQRAADRHAQLVKLAHRNLFWTVIGGGGIAGIILSIVNAMPARSASQSSTSAPPPTMSPPAATAPNNAPIAEDRAGVPLSSSTSTRPQPNTEPATRSHPSTQQNEP